MPGGISRVPLFLIATTFFCTPLFAQPVTAEDFLERAREHFERRRFLNALDSLRVVLDMTAQDDARKNRVKFDAEILSADSLKALGRLEEAANMYERSLVHGYEEKSVYAFLALYFDKHKRFEQALAYFAKYYALDKADVPTHIRYAALLGRLKRRAEAKQVLEGAEPRVAAQKSEDCSRLESQRKLREAAACFKTVREAQPDREQNYLGAYRVALALKDAKSTEENAELLYFIFGGDTRYIWPLIEWKLSRKKFYDARLLLEEVIRLRGKDSDAERLLANLQVQAGAALEKPFRATRKEMQMLESMRDREK
jgi:tetratricopeptide (TPR) repeat protein